ncbi:hypothetical protein ACFX2A_011728 [Malus domestica]
MIQRSNGSGRRILTYPAVHPSHSSADTPDVAHRSHPQHLLFQVEIHRQQRQKRPGNYPKNRLVRIFLEEVRDGSLGLPASAVLSLSELHLAFQKVQFLLEDLARDDARVWMLMNSSRVASQFRVLSRAMGTALDVLPLGLVSAAVEVKEHVQLVARQARKAGYEVDPDDIRVASAEVGQVREASQVLGFGNWSREFERGEERGGLKGLMCYCRCVLFDVVDGEPGRRSETKCGGGGGGEAVGCFNLEDFRCPISLEIMADPVTVATGQSYDRCSIAKWFRADNLICPKTGEKLKNTEVVPNLALKRLIQQLCFENGGAFADSGRRNLDIGRARLAVAGSLADEGAMQMVAEFLNGRLAVGTVEEQNKSRTRLLMKSGFLRKQAFLTADSVTQEKAIAPLLNVSKYSKSKAVIVENGGLNLMVGVLEKGLKSEARQHAAGTLFYLSSTEEYRRLIGETADAIPALMALIKDGTDRARKNALVVIFGLLTHPANHRRVIAAGVVPLLVHVLTLFDSEALVMDALAILSTLAEKADGSIAILRCKALDSIVGILNSSIPRAGKEFCVSLLLALCVNGSGDVVALLAKSPSLMGTLYSQLSEGTSRASKKASSLIRVLHEFHERSSGSISPVLPQERFVHVM